MRFYGLDPTREYAPGVLETLAACIPILQAEEAIVRASTVVWQVQTDKAGWQDNLRVYQRVAESYKPLHERAGLRPVTTLEAHEKFMRLGIPHFYDGQEFWPQILH